MASTSWLNNILALFTFFRWTAVWMTVCLTPMSIFGLSSILGIMLCVTSGLAFVHNLAVAITQQKERKRRSTQGFDPNRLPQKMVVILFDFIFGVVFLACWILLVGYSGWWYYGDTGRVWNVLWAYSVVGAMVAAHYHLFFASVGLHAWRQAQNGGKAAARGEQRTSRDVELDSSDIARQSSSPNEPRIVHSHSVGTLK